MAKIGGYAIPGIVMFFIWTVVIGPSPGTGPADRRPPRAAGRPASMTSPAAPARTHLMRTRFPDLHSPCLDRRQAGVSAERRTRRVRAIGLQLTFSHDMAGSGQPAPGIRRTVRPPAWRRRAVSRRDFGWA